MRIIVFRFKKWYRYAMNQQLTPLATFIAKLERRARDFHFEFLRIRKRQEQILEQIRKRKSDREIARLRASIHTPDL